MTLLDFLDKHFDQIGAGVIGLAFMVFCYFAIYREQR